MIAARGAAFRSVIGRVASTTGIVVVGSCAWYTSSSAGPSVSTTPRRYWLEADDSRRDDDHATSSSLTRQQSTLTSPSHSSELIVPTLEAAVRILRLVKTAVLMAADYKLAAWFPSQEDDSSTIRFWQQQVQRCEQALDDAQDVYTQPSPTELDGDTSRQVVKARQKKHMQQCATELASAQEQLTSIIGSDHNNVHFKAAHRLLALCQANQGVYIKIGQHLANLDYLIPHEYIPVLSALFQNNPQTPYEKVQMVIQQDLGAAVDDLFDRFDPEPMASASLAQVHVAYDKTTGRKLAVKVQHYGLRETSRGDLFALVNVVRWAERWVDGFSWGWLADEIAPQLPKELDFRMEGCNAERAAADLRRVGGGQLACVVPKVLWEYSSQRVLTMEFEEGFPATDLDAIRQAGLKERDVAKLIASVFGSQVFLSGWVHCDPHPANVLIRANRKNGQPEMVLVDHGLYKELDPGFRRCYANLWRSLMLADLTGIRQACHSLGVNDQAYALFASMLTARPFDELLERSKKGSLRNNDDAQQVGSRADQAVIRNYAQRYVTDIFDLLGSLPRQMLLLLKMNDCLRHIDYSLGSPTNTIVVSGSYAARAVYQDTIHRSDVSWRIKWVAWWDYVRVICRVRCHDVVVGWMDWRSTLRLR